MLEQAQSSDFAGIFKMVILNVVIIILLVAVVLLLGWFHGKRRQKGGLEDFDWEEEKKKLDFLAAEKKAMRGDVGENPGDNKDDNHGGSDASD